ncbi:MAG: hypothetical protein FWC78_03485 [Defluviitaleaceae bacterium]|nr:hypothetical protein [Defluviitaleaceae bacterium]
MAAFELQDNTAEPFVTPVPAADLGHDPRRVKDECIVAYKVYDSCRRQNCLTHKELSPVIVMSNKHDHGKDHEESVLLEHIPGAATVTMDKVTIDSIQVISKKPCPFRNGFWDVVVKYVFKYNLLFCDAKGKPIKEETCASIFTMKVTLFGSTGSDLVVGTDLYSSNGGSTFTAAPFIWAEAKAVGLDAKIHNHHGKEEVQVTIGLFSIIKLFRLVHLNVQSKGFCIPHECHEQGDINPCEYFSELDFPMDIFAPPQRK